MLLFFKLSPPSHLTPLSLLSLFFFFFNDTATTEIYTLSLHDALPISNSFDLIFRGLELVTGGQRLHRYADYLSVLAERGQDPAPFAGYLEAFKHGIDRKSTRLNSSHT